MNSPPEMSQIRSLVLPVTTGDPRTLTGSDEFRYIDIASIDRKEKLITSAALLTIDKAPSRARQLVMSWSRL